MEHTVTTRPEPGREGCAFNVLVSPPVEEGKRRAFKVALEEELRPSYPTVSVTEQQSKSASIYTLAQLHGEGCTGSKESKATHDNLLGRAVSARAMAAAGEIGLATVKG